MRSLGNLSRAERRAILCCGLLVIALTVLRCSFAATIELRMDEAYYWAWSREKVVSFLDHPPLIAWCVRFGTWLFGDTPFGIRFTGLVGMLAIQVLLVDIVWRITRDVRSTLVALLLPEASLYFGLSMAKVTPDTALAPLLLLTVWALVRLAESEQGRWWLVAGLAAGFALLAKYTAVFLLPAVAIFLLMPSQRRWLATPWPWAAMLLAGTLFMPVILWNGAHNWASFRFQFGRLAGERPITLRFLGDFIGIQFALVGPVLFPVAVINTLIAAVRAWRWRNAAVLLIAAAALIPLGYFLWRSLTLRIFENWPLFLWPFAFAAIAINLSWGRRFAATWMPDRHGFAWVAASLVSGVAIVATASGGYVSGAPLFAGRYDPIGQQASFAAVAEEVARQLRETGATWVAATEYGTWARLNWYLRGQVPVIQINQRVRFIGWQAPDMGQVQGKTGLLVNVEGQNIDEMVAATSARLQFVEKLQGAWRGTTFDEAYLVRKIEGAAVVLDPPPDSPLYGAPNW